VERAPVSCRLPQGVAEFVAAKHAAGTLTLVIANTVRRAVEIRVALEKKTTGGAAAAFAIPRGGSQAACGGGAG